jgi:cell division protein FtsI (penicillin-binding protein 3)
MDRGTDRGTDRGAGRDGRVAEGRAPEGRTADDRDGFGGISDARAYTPRGRTVRENAERARAGRTAGRPALQVLDGGVPAPVRDRRRGGPDALPEEPRGRTTTRRTPAPDPKDPARDDRPARGRGAPLDEPARADGRRGAAGAAREPRAGLSRTQPREALSRTEPRAGLSRTEPREALSRTEPRAAARTQPRTPAARTTAAPGTRGDGNRTTGTRGAGNRGADGPGTGTRGATRGARPRPDQRTAAPRQPRDRRGDARPRTPAKRPAAVAAPPPKLADYRRRLRLGTVFALALFVVIAGRLVVLQLFNTPAYAASITEQRQNRLAKVALPAPRGAIYDRGGAALARSVEARYVYADPELVENPDQVAATLSRLLGKPYSELRPKLNRTKRPGGGLSRFEYLARGVDIVDAERIVAANLPGIGTHRDERRDVPGADLAANLIGFTGQDMTGLEGMEARYDDLLRGQDGQRVFERGNPHVDEGQLAKEIPGGFRQETPAQPGSSLVLTIDSDLQFAVQRILGERMRKLNAQIAAAVVLDVKTGEVLAQASYPSYNAAQPTKSKPTDREDVASGIVVDPGSTHKALIFGAALQEGIVKPDSTVTVGPALVRGGTTFQDGHPHPRNTKVTLAGLMAYSSNVGTIRLGEMLGPQRVYEYQQKFGLGKPTGEGVAGELPGRLLPPSEWSGSAVGSVPIGHSVDATLIQMAATYATIANDGTYVQPHLLKETVAGDGTRQPAPAPETRQVLSPANAAALRTMMEAVVSVKGGTGNLAAIDGYRVAGKTGTGSRLVDGRYTKSETGSFIGMAPAEDPRYVVAVLADTPNGTGGVVAGPAFKEMMEFTLAHYRVPPSGTKPPKFTIVP